MLNANGYWPLLYESRLRAALREAQHGGWYAPEAEISALTRGQQRPVLDAVESAHRSQEHGPIPEAYLWMFSSFKSMASYRILP